MWAWLLSLRTAVHGPLGPLGVRGLCRSRNGLHWQNLPWSSVHSHQDWVGFSPSHGHPDQRWCQLLAQLGAGECHLSPAVPLLRGTAASHSTGGLEGLPGFPQPHLCCSKWGPLPRPGEGKSSQQVSPLLHTTHGRVCFHVPPAAGTWEGSFCSKGI